MNSNINYYQTKFPQYATAPLQCMVNLFSGILSKAMFYYDGEDLFAAMKENIEESTLSVLAEVLIPELRKYYPDIGTPPTLNNMESLTRLKQCLCSWLCVVSKLLKGRVIILFIDDLQWAESSSISMIASILSMETLPLFMFCALRGNEIEGKDHINHLLTTIAEANPARVISLGPLDENSVFQIIQEMTASSSKQIKALAHIVTKKTQGNPFFVTQFVTTLYNDELLTFEFDKQEWNVPLDLIKERDYTSNVVELLIREISKLPDHTRTVLATAACIGPQFDISLVCELCNLPRESVMQSIYHALQNGFLQPKYHHYGVGFPDRISDFDSCSTEHISDIEEFSFLHDRVHEGFYTYIPEETRMKLHFQIGMKLKDKITDDSSVGELFNVISHFKRCESLITTLESILTVVDINIKASSFGKQMGSFSHVLQFGKTAQQLLYRYYSPDDCWKHQYKRIHNVYCIICDIYTVASVTSSIEQVNQDYDMVYQHVKDPLQRLEFYLLENHYYNNTLQYSVAANRLGMIMEEFGYPIPETVTMEDFAKSLKEFTDATADSKSTFDTFMSLNPSTDELSNRYCEVIIVGSPAIYLAGNPARYCLLLLSIAQIM